LSRLLLAALIGFTVSPFAAAQEGGHVPGVHVPVAAAVTQTIKDDLGRPFPLPGATPGRIVSMAPNVTEILFALGLGGRIVGVTRFCDWPSEAKAIPKIGGLVDPNIEVIRSLDPDLVIAFRGNPLRLVDRVRKLGLAVFVLDIGEDLDELFPLIERIGRVTRTETRAAELVAGLRSRVEAVDAGLRGALSRPKVFALLYGQGLWTCGGESYLDDLIARAGGVNVAAALPKKWTLYKRERIIKDDPDVVFILARAEDDFASGRDRLARTPGMDGVAAVRTGRIFELDENAASRFGPRLVDVLVRMATLLHPGEIGGRT
jgi:iron complex transport system substrate-binding protein